MLLLRVVILINNLNIMRNLFFIQATILVILFTGCNSNVSNTAKRTITAQDSLVLSQLYPSSAFYREVPRHRSLAKAYEQPDSVFNLAIYAQNLGTVPENIDTFKNLQLLGLDFNQLSSLPESVGNLTYLQKIHLNKNEFTEFPEVLTKNRYLKDILISDNKISYVTPEIANLVFLENLVMNDNELGEMPMVIFELDSLKVLGLRDNELTELPDEFEKLKNLQKLNLQNNQLKDLPESLLNLPLERLTLKGNPIATVRKNEIEKRMPNTEIIF